jgi:cation diffusion facilitator family transporter
METVSVTPPTPPTPSARGDDSFGSVFAALAANTAIATAKGIAAALTGSAALFAETLHTIADAGNEVFLFIAIRRSGRPADASHPFGYGPERYYWALLAAMGMFVVGGAVSIWEGVHALVHPPELEAFWVGVAVLVVAIVLDGLSRTVALRALRRQAAARGIALRQLLRESPDPTVTTVYLEDTVDVLGAVLALLALVLHRVTGSALPDALATLVIGCLLAYVAMRLSGRNRALLTNQSVPARYVEKLAAQLLAQDGIVAVDRVEAVYLGPSQVLAVADVTMAAELDGEGVTAALVAARARLCHETPAIARLYLTPVAEVRTGTGTRT